MSSNLHNAFAGEHPIPGFGSLHVYYADRRLVLDWNKARGIARGHHLAYRCGWYYVLNGERNGAPVLVEGEKSGGPYSSSRAAYQAGYKAAREVMSCSPVS